MSASTPPTPPDFDGEFLEAVEKWREQHKVTEDDAIFALLDLFRIHQKHWDEIRRRQMPSLDELRGDMAVLTEIAKILKEKATKEVRAVPLPTALFAAIATALAGFLIGKFL